MPRELVVNRALSGLELKKLILADVQKLVDNEGMLSDYIAFGRVGYDIRLRLHMDNPMSPESAISMSSTPLATNFVEKNPHLAAVERAPLSEPSTEESVAATELQRVITSPNEERVRAGIPVPAIVQQQDGTKITELIKYPPDETLGDGNMTIEDKTREARAEWGLPNAPIPLPATEPTPSNLTGVGKCGHGRDRVALSGICTVCDKEWVDSAAPDKAPEAWPVGKE